MNNITQIDNSNKCILVKEGSTIQLNHYNNKPILTTMHTPITHSNNFYKVCVYNEINFSYIDIIIALFISIALIAFINIFNTINRKL